eukprot:gene49526-67260_t
MRNASRLLLAALAVALPGAGHADKRNNILGVAFTNEVTTLDPANGFSGSDYPILYSIYERLIGFDPKTMLPVPGLASAWEFAGADNQRLAVALDRRRCRIRSAGFRQNGALLHGHRIGRLLRTA